MYAGRSLAAAAWDRTSLHPKKDEKEKKVHDFFLEGAAAPEKVFPLLLLDPILFSSKRPLIGGKRAASAAMCQERLLPPQPPPRSFVRSPPEGGREDGGLGGAREGGRATEDKEERRRRRRRRRMEPLPPSTQTLKSVEERGEVYLSLSLSLLFCASISLLLRRWMEEERVHVNVAAPSLLPLFFHAFSFSRPPLPPPRSKNSLGRDRQRGSQRERHHRFSDHP